MALFLLEDRDFKRRFLDENQKPRKSLFSKRKRAITQER
jgi:hypothetical protein